MLSAQAGELSVVLCTSLATTAQQSSDSLAHQHQHQHHGSHSADPAPSSAESSGEGLAKCPFAAPTTTAAIELPEFVGDANQLEHEPPTGAVGFASSGPQRAQRIRGPPASI